MLTRLRMSPAGLIAALALTVAHGAPAAACPDCREGREARHQVWTQNFGANLLMMVLPLIVIVAVAAVVERS